jgi:hypothetical protein
MSVLESDTGIRSSVLSGSWGAASDQNTWTLASGSSVPLSATKTSLQITASTTTNMIIGVASVQNVAASVQVTVQSSGDSPVLFLRYTDTNNYIKCDVVGGLLRIRKNVAPGGFTTIASVSFVQTPNVAYQFVFQVHGTTYSAKAYQVNTPDPGWLISATAGDSILASGKWGLSANSASLPVSYSQFAVNNLRADNPYNITDNPYGVTVYHSNAATSALAQLIPDMQALGLTWLRYQVPFTAIDSPQATYTWTSLDAMVSVANAANINIIFSMDQAPSWGLDGTTGLPTPAYTTTVAGLVAARYNGLTGHGHLDSIEIWNEEFDFSSYNNTTYGAVASAGYTAIRGAGFTGKVGCAAMLGVSNTAHITNWITQLYTSVVSSLFDYYSLHYYNAGNDPSVTGAYLSIPTVLSTVNAALIANSDALKPVWITEFGYATSTNGGHSAGSVVSALLQNQYYAYMLSAAHGNSQQSGVGPVQKILFYSMDTDPTNTDGESITQGLTPSEAYSQTFGTLKAFIDTYYYWPGAVAQFPVTSRRTGQFPATNRRGS